MKIVVYDIAAQKGGGGETILKQYFDTAARQTENEWWFFVSIEEYVERSRNNMHVIYIDLGKKTKTVNYVKRKQYEVLKLRRIIKSIEPDEFISLQNMIVSSLNCKQTVYLHQSFQFSPVRFSFFKKNERSLAFRQKFICGVIKRKLKKADKVIVQTNWMKNAVSKWAQYPEDRIIVETPDLALPVITSETEKLNNVFFYPANAYLNKNHQIIIEACKIIKRKGYSDFRILFTLSPDSNMLASTLYDEVKEAGLPIEFVGHLDREELYRKYRSQILLFPSYIETFGLPLLEAKCLGGRIIASNCPFSHEILDNYSFAEFVDWNNADDWATAIINHI